MKGIAKAVKTVSKFAAAKSVNSASFFYFYQERETKEVKDALKKNR